MAALSFYPPLDGSHLFINPIAFGADGIRAVSLVNQCSAGNLIVQTDDGRQQICAPLVEQNIPLRNSLTLQAWIDTPQATGQLEVIVYDSPIDYSTNQLAELAGGGTVSKLANQTAILGADVPMANANQYYDGPSVTLPAGIWLIIAQIFVDYGGANDVTAKLWDGAASVLASGEFKRSGNTAPPLATITLHGIASPAVSTTYKISAACDAAAQTIKAAAEQNPAGNTATKITAVQIG